MTTLNNCYAMRYVITYIYYKYVYLYVFYALIVYAIVRCTYMVVKK